MKNIYPLLELSLNKFNIKYISNSLDVNENTIRRWIEKKEVPNNYYFDFCRLNKLEINYNDHTEKEKDQFYTPIPTAEYCYNKSIEIISKYESNLDKYNFIEPSAGSGNFFRLLPKDKRVGLDIEPKYDGIISSDFLLWYPNTENNICIGNPPFGLRGNLALKFINHAQKFSDYVCFILPQLFNSNGKGSCKSRVKKLNLIHNELISPEFIFPNGKSVNVNVVFQIWSKKYKIEEETYSLSGIIKLYSLSDGGTPSTTRNKSKLYSCDYYLSSTCFGEDNMKLYFNFNDLPQKKGYGIKILNYKEILDPIINSIKWSEVAFVSTNGAYNLRFDLIEKEIFKYLPRTISQVSQSRTKSLLSLLQ